MRWNELEIAEDYTHHLREGRPAYAERFDEVLKFHEPGLAPVRKGGTAWHINPNGQEAYLRRFQRTFGFYEGLAAVDGEQGWHHIHPDGTDAYPQRYSWCGNFQDGRCTVRQFDGKYLHIKPDSEPAYRERWRYAGDFRDGVGIVQAEDGRSTHIGEDGQQTHGQWFLDLDVFHKGFARARDDSGWMHVDSQGKPAYSRRFSAVEPFYNGQARVERLDGGLEVIDEVGKTLVELRPPLRSEFEVLSGDMVGYWKTKTIAAAVELGVFESLDGTSEILAARCKMPAEGMLRLLGALGELGLVSMDEGIWRATPKGCCLKKSHPQTLADAALEYGGELGRSWDNLQSALRSPSCGPTGIFKAVAEDPGRRDSHHRMLRSYALHDYPGIAHLLPISDGDTVVDAGGGTGTLAEIVANKFSKAEVVLMDLPEIVSMAGVNPRIRKIGADIFEPWPLAVDVVLLARVLHDWPDSYVLKILKKARRALNPGGRVVVIERALPQTGHDGSLCDLHLMAVTGGIERTIPEYKDLMESAGFKLLEERSLPAHPSVLIGVLK